MKLKKLTKIADLATLRADIRMAQALIVEPSGCVVDICRDPQSTTEQTFSDEKIAARAVLIAHAVNHLPALVEALEACLTKFTDAKCCAVGGASWTAIRDQARAALAAAKEIN